MLLYLCAVERKGSDREREQFVALGDRDEPGNASSHTHGGKSINTLEARVQKWVLF